jgi:hypothetical protein
LPAAIRLPRIHFSVPHVASGAVVLVLLLGGGWLVLRTMARDSGVTPANPSVPTLQHLVMRELPAAPSRVTLVAPEYRAASARAAVPGEEYGHISVARTTWVFVRYQDNSTVERVLSPGDRLVLRSVPVYLAAGEAPGAEIVIVGHPIDATQFNVNGQLRIGSAFLSAALRR